MAGALTISTLNNDTGVLATQNGMTGIAKAWVQFNGSAVIQASFNVSSITKNGTGDNTINFTTAMPSANYAAFYSGNRDATGNYGYPLCIPYNQAPTTTTIRVFNGPTTYDWQYNYVAIFSA